LQANDTFDVFLLWTIWTLAATGAALLFNGSVDLKDLLKQAETQTCGDQED
jgi:hypothetical protein